MDGLEALRNNIEALVKIVAYTSLWASPKVVEKLFKEENNTTGSWFDNSRRIRKNEKIGYNAGYYLDNNTKANNAIKAALGFDQKPTNFATCHIYEETTYDCGYHTSIPNLVLVPRPIYSLTDHLPERADFLRYYSYFLYGFYIGNIPKKPDVWSAINLSKIIIPTEKQVEKALKSLVKRKRLIDSKISKLLFQE